jgi:hypothetical protein
VKPKKAFLQNEPKLKKSQVIANESLMDILMIPTRAETNPFPAIGAAPMDHFITSMSEFGCKINHCNGEGRMTDFFAIQGRGEFSHAPYGVFTPYTDQGNGAIFNLDWRLAVEEQCMPEKPAKSGMRA